MNVFQITYIVPAVISFCFAAGFSDNKLLLPLVLIGASFLYNALFKKTHKLWELIISGTILAGVLVTIWLRP